MVKSKNLNKSNGFACVIAEEMNRFDEKKTVVFFKDTSESFLGAVAFQLFFVMKGYNVEKVMVDDYEDIKRKISKDDLNLAIDIFPEESDEEVMEIITEGKPSGLTKEQKFRFKNNLYLIGTSLEGYGKGKYGFNIFYYKRVDKNIGTILAQHLCKYLVYAAFIVGEGRGSKLGRIEDTTVKFLDDKYVEYVLDPLEKEFAKIKANEAVAAEEGETLEKAERFRSLVEELDKRRDVLKDLGLDL